MHYDLTLLRFCEILHWLGGERNIFHKGVDTSLPSRRVLKTVRENPENKAQREQYLLAVGLGYYTFRVSHSKYHTFWGSIG